MRKVLIIDDEEKILKCLVRVIEEENCQVFTAKNGEDGIAKYFECNPDIVFLDIQMPDMEGPQVLKKILEKDPKANIYFMTGSVGVISPADAIAAGAKGYLTKPVQYDDIIKTIHQGNTLEGNTVE